MTEVQALVNRLLEDAGMRPDTEIGQTVMLTTEARDRLEALAKYFRESKTRLASRLLVAAINDAIMALPNTVKERRDDMLPSHIDTGSDDTEWLGARDLVLASVREQQQFRADGDLPLDEDDPRPAKRPRRKKLS